MSRDKQVEEMAKDLQKSEHWYFNDHSVDFELDRKKTAENLYNAGYRKASDVALETIAEAIEVVRHIFDEAKVRANNETNVLLRCQFRGEQIGTSLAEYALAELKKKYTEGE